MELGNSYARIARTIIIRDGQQKNNIFGSDVVHASDGFMPRVGRHRQAEEHILVVWHSFSYCLDSKFLAFSVKARQWAVDGGADFFSSPLALLSHCFVQHFRLGFFSAHPKDAHDWFSLSSVLFCGWAATPVFCITIHPAAGCRYHSTVAATAILRLQEQAADNILKSQPLTSQKVVSNQLCFCFS